MVECIWGILGAVERVFCRPVVQLSTACGSILVEPGEAPKGDTMTITFAPVALDNFDRDAYLKGYTVLVDGEAVGTTYQCISGGWTGADVQEPSTDGTTIYTVRSLWQRRRDAAADLAAAHDEETP